MSDSRCISLEGDRVRSHFLEGLKGSRIDFFCIATKMYSVSRRELAKRAWRSGATVLDVSRSLTSAAVTPLSNALNGGDKVCVSSFINTGVGRFLLKG